MTAFKSFRGVASYVLFVGCILGTDIVRAGLVRSSGVDDAPLTLNDLIEALQMDGLQWDDPQWDDLQLDDLQLDDQANPLSKEDLKDLINTLRLIISLGKENFACTCSGLSCRCCHGVDISYLRLKGDLCIHAELDLRRYGLLFTLSFGGKVIYRHEISARKPPPLCFPFYGAKACVEFSNLHFGHGRISGCTKIRFYAWRLCFYTLDLGCFGLNVVSRNSTEAYQAEGVPQSQQTELEVQLTSHQTEPDVQLDEALAMKFLKPLLFPSRKLPVDTMKREKN